MKYYIIAGEASGDLHGSHLIRSLKQKNTACHFRAWGGEKMQAEGAQLVKHYRDLAFMGFIEVIWNLRTILRNLAFCKKDITAFQPDIIILIDYPGFNLRIAEWAHQKNFKVIYYISPQVWAWKPGRVKKMKETIDKMLVILPFEKAYYHDVWNWEVVYVGHPLVDVVDEHRSSSATLDIFPPAESNKKIVALLPGSRKQEIRQKLPVMLEVSKRFPDHLFVVAKAPGIEEAFYEEMMRAYPAVRSVHGQTYALLQTAFAALVTSGTATLETALFGVPQIVCYKGNPISHWIARQLLTIKYISLVNLILDKPAVKELIQNEFNVDQVSSELDLLLYDPEKRSELTATYASLRSLLEEGGGNAAQKAAAEILTFAST